MAPYRNKKNLFEDVVVQFVHQMISVFNVFQCLFTVQGGRHPWTHTVGPFLGACARVCHAFAIRLSDVIWFNKDVQRFSSIRMISNMSKIKLRRARYLCKLIRHLSYYRYINYWCPVESRSSEAWMEKIRTVRLFILETWEPSQISICPAAQVCSISWETLQEISGRINMPLLSHLLR